LSVSRGEQDESWNQQSAEIKESKTVTAKAA
jgi:hypothetical protein